ncbi:TonB-dependent receptor [Sphingomonas sp. BE270]|jgi:iron complex outermembrane receptor protein|nr:MULTISPECIES: TonB-dependent receptor [unclassified Sphingomonas]MDR6847975.1 TonB-dependent receptor [Sphingomonas sp. BE137]MDR7258345.1 TonB-dependent receptor [Sphingomonas sp. BE270]
MRKISAAATVQHGVSVGALALALFLPSVALAQTEPTPSAPPASEDTGQDIVVTGFRQSLQAALNVKKNSVAAVDSIVAEDIAKFPDQNLAESLQRIPGISIQRDGGEGRAITVRGLGAQFTRVRVNGMETVATSTDGASANRDRAFDFNVFASELFSSLVVHKTAEASLDEGSLGAVVDLNTGNPLGGKKAGFSGALSVQGSYNDLAKTLGPRVAGLLSWRNEAGTFGASVSAAYSKVNTLELGNNTTRWAQAQFDSVDGTPCYYNTTGSGAAQAFTTPAANSGGVYRQSAACDKAAQAFHPRIPRYGVIKHDRERLGITASVQFAPTDKTKISIDGLYSKFKETREEEWLEVLARSNERSIDLVNPVYDANNNIVSATLNDAYNRNEHYLRKSSTEFYQIGGTWDQDVTDKFRFTLLGGLSKSDANIPVETTILLDNKAAQGFKYDYTNMSNPRLSYGSSVTDPSAYQLSEIRDRPSETVNKFRTVQLRTEWDVADGFQIKAGGVYRKFTFDTVGFTRDTVVCGNGGKDLVLGTLTCSPSSQFGSGAVYGFPVTAALTDLVNLGSAGQPSGATSQYVVANIPAAATLTNLYNRALVVDAGNTRSVSEKVTGGYLEFDTKGALFGLNYAFNAGVRYVHTDQSSTGLVSGTAATVQRSYDDWLPALNVAFYPTDKIIVRGAVAKVMTRPTLGNLTPGGTVDGFNYKISNGNPFLDPFRATAYDIALEWYFAPQSIASIALFKKSIDSFPVSNTLTQTFASTGLPKSVLPPSSPAYINFDPNQLYTVSTTVNGTGASLKGIELSVQAPFKFLPGFLKNFGGIANATFIDSSATYGVVGPSSLVCATQFTCKLVAPTAVQRTSTLFGLSKKAFNGTLYYEDAKFSARGSISYRGPYVDQNSGTGNVFEGYAATTNFDASVRYRLTKWLEVSVEGTNLTDTYRYRYTDVDANRNYENNHFGRTILFGARVKM